MVFVYLPDRQEAVLFGGQNATGSYVGETWIWKAGCWTQVAPAHSPAARKNAAAAYDSSRHVVVMYGYYPTSGGPIADTWTWNGDDWQQAATSGLDCNNGVAAYDQSIQRVVLFCGWSNQTWTWDGTRWQQMSPSTEPGGRVYASMAVDPTTHKLLLFGGQRFNPSQYLADTWLWSGADWTQLTPQTSPPARANAIMVSASFTGRLLLVGGQNGSALGDAWTWNGATWTATGSIGPRGGGSAIDTGSRVVAFGGYGDKQVTNDVWVWDGTSWAPE